MTQKRFDLGAVARLQSRLGNLSKGGLIRNGFTEVRANKEVWSWQRPALASSTAAPFIGSPLGLFIWGTILYGMMSGTATGASGGTATSFSIYNRPTGTPFTLVAATQSDNPGFYGWGQFVQGTLVPFTWNGNEVWQFMQHTSSNFIDLEFVGSYGTGTYPVGTVSVSSSVLALATAAVTNLPGPLTNYRWSILALSSTGTYTGNFK